MGETADQHLREYVTAVIGGQLFGLPILRVQDVFAPERLTTVPLAPAEIAGVLNLRGHIVTLINMRRRLGLGDQEGGGSPMAVGVESRGESYGWHSPDVPEVLKLADIACEPNPTNLDRGLATVSTGIYRLDGQLLMVLDVDRVLDIAVKAAAA